MLTSKQLKLLACPVDKFPLKQQRNKLVCTKCKKEYGFKQGFPMLIPDLTDDVRLSMVKWDEMYQKDLKSKKYLRDLKDYQENHQPKIVEQIDAVKKINRSSTYLEIGSGLGYIGLHYGKTGATIVGIDLSPTALKIGQELAKEHKIKNTLFVIGDITQMPFAKNSFDFIYGGGTIEHFKNTDGVLKDIYRILRPDGVSFNTVPCLNIGTIYRMRWGNIPNFPIVRQIFEFINLTILKGKHMTFGYELSFLPSTLTNLHRKAGFKKINIERFDTYLVLESVPIWSKNFFAYLCTNSPLFWPMHKAIARK